MTEKTGLWGTDPAVQLWINLEHVATGAVVDQPIVGIDEAGDVGEPSADWGNETVVAGNLEGEHKVSGTLRRIRQRWGGVASRNRARLVHGSDRAA